MDFSGGYGTHDDMEPWRRQLGQRPGIETARGTAGVDAGKWDRVTVFADNAKLPVGESQVGRMSFNFTTTPTEAEKMLYVPRALSAVRNVRILQFNWPILPSSSLPAMKTNRAEVGVQIAELSARRATSFAGVPAHFIGDLNSAETVELLSYQSASAATITDAINRSISAKALFYNDSLALAPPVNLESLTLDISRGGQRPTFLPFRISVTFDFSGAATTMSLASGAAHGLEAGMKIVFAEAVVDGAGTPATVTEFAVDSEIAIDAIGGSPATTASFTTGDIDPAGYTGTSPAVTVLVPARRVQVGFEFEVARMERE